MKTLRLVLPALVLLGLTATGCIITSAQVLTHFDLPNPFTINASNPADLFEQVPVDLNTIGDYNDNKDKLKGLTDLAILGTFVNLTNQAGTVSVYITPNLDGPQTSVPGGATLLWGPATIGANETKTLNWDDSAALFNSAGKAVLIAETKGDGTFTLYTTGGPAGVYNIRVDEGELVLTLDAGI